MAQVICRDLFALLKVLCSILLTQLIVFSRRQASDYYVVFLACFLLLMMEESAAYNDETQMKESTPVVQWLSYSPLDPRFAGSIPAGVDGFFQSVKIRSMTSFGREGKPWVPCRRFTAR